MNYDIKRMPVEGLRKYVNNPKEHTPEQVRNIARSLEEFGFVWPVLLDKDNTVIAGHGRLQAAELLGMAEVPAMRAEHLTPGQVKAFRIADNRLAVGNWLEDPLRVELEGLADLDFDLGMLGFDDKELNDILKKAWKEDDAPGGEASEGEAPEAFQVLVTCGEEARQVALIERLEKEGYQCRALVS